MEKQKNENSTKAAVEKLQEATDICRDISSVAELMDELCLDCGADGSGSLSSESLVGLSVVFRLVGKMALDGMGKIDEADRCLESREKPQPIAIDGRA